MTPSREETTDTYIGESLGTGSQVSNETGRRHTGKCYDCGGLLELVEFDVKKGTRIMKCQECGLYHFHKKELFGGWKLLKVSKMPNKE